ncbi:DNA replication/repair protein RecF [Bacterioplanes sanyensis]|uniref:DNA replication and repair protein RecF n=1 Tax=Bacterioplanes sanyensis TaxID=1249553 RepID=A0A222FG46_9GAMM|nr:DNA replication/repair protein RecF [Bacterioplanes sanyensis]ASP37968.1 DNA replication/repair protein RecF [Bacterioplanes sanyensis]
MPIRQLSVSGVRNLQPLTLTPHPYINFLYGDNGSGKSSVLESIALMASGKSFRTSQFKFVLSQQAERMELSLCIDDENLGEAELHSLRLKTGDQLLKINGSVLTSQAEAAHWLPVQVIEPNTFRLLSGSPEERRQFIDWGVFHVEHEFMDHWKTFRKQLKQRNAVLKQKEQQWLEVWNPGFIESSEAIDAQRQSYLKRFKPEFDAALAQLDETLEVELAYYRGWEKDTDLASVLERQQERDLAIGYTQSGPHRAELRIKCGKQPAVEILSRGQQKTVVAALKVAQGSLFQKESDRRTIYLVDDLASELDEKHRFALCKLLEDLKCQVFITSIDKEKLTDIWRPTASKVFHVEHGVVTEIDHALPAASTTHD